MGQFVAGIFTGIVMCMVAMLVRCVLWYEKKHPEDDYWRRLAPPGAPDAQDKGAGEGDYSDCGGCWRFVLSDRHVCLPCSGFTDG